MQAVGPPWEIDFNPRAPCGARLFAARASVCSLVFQSTRPVRGATGVSTPIWWCTLDFNPRAPCGARPDRKSIGWEVHEFQSTRPVRGATLLMREDKKHEKISIHAPRAGRDTRRWWRPSSGRYFNPRAPCGARPPMPSPESGWWRFQSTRPVRGATCRQTASDSLVGFQSTRPVRGATAVVMAGVFDFAISIHAPRAGRDARDGPPSTGGRISIHAPRAGRDSCRSSWRSRHTDFNPRAPCGARPHILPDAVFQFGFQSTRPVRGATGCIIGP